MAESPTERRLAENEVFFRERNQILQKLIDDVKEVAAEDNVTPPEFDEDTPLYFLCECSNAACRERIELSLKEYEKHHKRSDTFTIKQGHDIKIIETVTFETGAYAVVTKKEQPPKEAAGLNTVLNI